MGTHADNALAVRLLLLDMETKAGLAELSEGELNMLSAIVLCGGVGEAVKPGELRQHPLVKTLTHPTYHRMLRSLIERGMVEYFADPDKGRGYSVTWKPALPAELPAVKAVL